MTDPHPPRRNTFAVAAPVVGLVALIGGLLVGIRFSGVDALTWGFLAVLVGGVAMILGIIGIVVQRGGVVPAAVGVALGALVIVAVFVGRYLGENFLGFPYPG
jgi:hypothetical protein